jgi:hypothetical protein
MLMCREHWFRVPQEIRNRIWNTYREGQSIDTVTPAYLRAAAEAIEVVARSEGLPIDNPFRRILDSRTEGADAPTVQS